MKHEKSCGAVVFLRTDDGIRYYIIRSKTGIWGFPKGHMEAGESERQTALREIKEETGLDVKLVDGFLRTEKYCLRHGDQDIVKKVVYFLAETKSQTPKRQKSEISEIRLMTYEEANEIFRFESSRRILTEADGFLSRRFRK